MLDVMPTKTREEEMVDELANVLDVMEPEWFERVDLDNFDLFDADRCVLYYTFGDYEEGEWKVQAWMSSEDDSIRDNWSNGSDVSYGCAFAANSYEPLWINAIMERRNA